MATPYEALSGFNACTGERHSSNFSIYPDLYRHYRERAHGWLGLMSLLRQMDGPLVCTPPQGIPPQSIA